MASSMAAAAAHSMPPFPLPAVPRVRPPPIPKGTPGPNTLPVPHEPKGNLVWSDGRWRNPNSSSAVHKKEVVSRQLEKALQHEVHGMNIYAYRHINTNQVVYSLTKNMENNKILKQLLYYGKQTVPSALRRDVWRPYFSIHFPKTPAGATKGLSVYQELRELSLQRQLDPPRELKIATIEDVERRKKAIGPNYQEKMDAENTNRGARHHKIILPMPGRRLPQKMLAKRLMNQKSSSVADVAAVLSRLIASRKDGQAALTPQQKIASIKQRQKQRESELGSKAVKRLEKIREQEAGKEVQLEAREEYIQSRPGYVRVDKHSLARLSTEYDGAVDFSRGSVGDGDLELMDQIELATDEEVGAQRRLSEALKRIDNDKQAETTAIEQRISTEIDQKIANMSEAERHEAQQRYQLAKARNRETIDDRIQKRIDAEKAQRDEINKKHAGDEKRRAIMLHRHKNDQIPKIMKFKADQERRLNWVGPYAGIHQVVNNALADIDEKAASELAELKQAVQAETETWRDPANHDVEIRWADMNDGTYAQQWPESVVHVPLQVKAVIQKSASVVRQHEHMDEEENVISQQNERKAVSQSNTVHVFGNDVPMDLAQSRYVAPEHQVETQTQLRDVRVQEWAQTEIPLVRDQLLALGERRDKYARIFADDLPNTESQRSIDNCMAELKIAREILDQITAGRSTDDDVYNLSYSLTYVRNGFQAVKDELHDSEDPDTDFAKMEYMRYECEMLELEVKHVEASKQADLKSAFWKLLATRNGHQQKIWQAERDIVERQAGVSVIGSADEKDLAHYEDELRDFDGEYPAIKERLDKIVKARYLDRTQEQLRELDQKLESATSTGDGIADLRSEKQKLMGRYTEAYTDILEKLKEDKPLWNLVKRADGLDGLRYNDYNAPDVQASESTPLPQVGMQQETQDEPVVMETRGLWARIKNIFSRK